MTVPVQSQPPIFNVTGITPGQYQTDAAGNTVQGHVVYYTLQDGTVGNVFIPDTQWNADFAKEKILEAVMKTHAIRNISNESY
jgi:hypothetical protein